MGKIRYCENCGNPLTQDMQFCDNCGAPVRREQAQNTQRSGSRPVRSGQKPQAEGEQVRRSQKPQAEGQQVRRGQRPQAEGQQVRRSRRPSQASQMPPNAGTGPYGADPGLGRYRQEDLGNDWQQSWDRAPDEDGDETGFTPLQYVMIGITAILLIAMVTFGVFWVLGRSSNKTASDRNTEQTRQNTESLQTGQDKDIEILDDAGTQTDGQSQTKASETTPQTNAQTETAPQTNAQTETTPQTSAQTETAPQTNAQTETTPQTNAQTDPIEIIDANQQAQGNAGGSYIAESSQRLITDADVSGMSYDDMQMAINEIYARHGRKFSSPEIQNYFDSQSWYQGTVDADNFSEGVFSSTEAENIQFLLGKMGIQ